MSPLPTPSELDAHAAKALHEATLTLQRGFAEGVVTARDCPQTLQALQELTKVVDAEHAVEASLDLRERMVAQSEGQANTTAAGAGQPGAAATGKRVAVFVDGSSNSYAALRWAVGNLVSTPGDQVHLVNIMPYEAFNADAQRTLQQAYDFAHHAGVRAAQLHTHALTAQASSRTAGVGEEVSRFVEAQGVEVVVLGSRGLGSIKSSLLGALGMGSVTDFCVQRLRCPVLVIKEAPGEEKSEAVEEESKED